MGQHTDIQWCDSTVNPTTGCDGCELWPGPCYAGHLHESRLAKSLPKLYAPDFTEVRLAPGRMAKAAAWPDLRGKPRPGKPWLDGLPRLIFVGDLGDVFSDAVPFDFLADEVVGAATSAAGSRHVWMLLTKRPTRMAAFAGWLRQYRGLPWPENVWPGTSVTDQKTSGRIAYLNRTPGDGQDAVRFVSFEPLRGPVDLTRLRHPERRGYEAVGGTSGIPSGLSLAIVGGESRQRGHEPTPFRVGWARDLVRQCREYGIRAFIKQLGSRVIECEPDDGPEWPCPLVYGNSGFVEAELRDHHGGDWSEWPADLRVRELPSVA